MWITKIKMAAALILAVSVIGVGGGLVAYRALAAGAQDEARQGQPAPPVRPRLYTDRRDEDLRKALDRIAVLEKQLADYKIWVAKLQADLAVSHADTMQARQAQQPKKARVPVPEVQSDPSSTEILPPEEKKAMSEAEQRGRAETIQQFQDQIELLEAQFLAKQAEVRAAEAAAHAARRQAARLEEPFKEGRVSQGEFGKVQQDVAGLEAQVMVKQAEMKEPELRLKQARRRLAALEGPKEQPGRAEPYRLEQRVRELEEKVKAMDHDLARLKTAVRPE